MYTKCWRYEPNERPSARKLVTILKSINSTPVDEIHLPENDESIPEIPSLHIHAVHWYQPAAKNGDKIAQYKLGLCYENGDGVKKDKVEAFEW
ncbi:unnamed protein product [Rhizophagus irregularis]|nr:unnamed protein product [Rhizophagus irregularis]